MGLFAIWQLYWTTYEADQVKEVAVEQFVVSIPDPPAVQPPEKHREAPPETRVPGDGQTMGLLRVPKWGHMAIPIAEGTSQYVLNRAYAGHYSETVGPGAIGNFSVAAHRRTYGNNFRRIDILQAGDPVVVETKELFLVYRVTEHEIVLPTQLDVVDPVPGRPGMLPIDRLMTMTTCHPEYGNSHRYIVHSKLDYWVYRYEGIPEELKGVY